MDNLRESDAVKVARGYLLVGVFYVHALYTMVESTADSGKFIAAAVQIKLLAPCIVALFFLSGMSSRKLRAKDALCVARQSLLLLLLAAGSHIIGELLLWLPGSAQPDRKVMEHVLLPLVLGTGYANYVGWFFVVLAVARVFAWLFERSKPGFVVLALVAWALIGLGNVSGLPDNAYEWRNWPLATLFLLCGIYFPPQVRVRWFVGLPSLPLSLAAGWLNRPGFLDDPLCLSCDMTFVAQPMVGQYGFLPLYLLQQALFILFLLWITGATRSMLIGRMGGYFGQRSLAMLVMHGWVILLLYPFITRGVASHESAYLFVSILCGLIVVHAFLFEIFEPALRRFVALAATLSRQIIPGRMRTTRRRPVWTPAAD